MSKINFKNKQINLTVQVEKKEFKVKVLDLIKNDYMLPLRLNEDKVNNRRNTESKLHSYCVISLRRRAVLTKYKLSRMMFRKYGENRMLNGLRKASW